MMVDGEAPARLTEAALEPWRRRCGAANPIGKATVLVRFTRRLPGTDGITGDGEVITFLKWHEGSFWHYSI